MKRTEIQEIAKKLVKYVEDHPNCKRSAATMSIPAHIPTIKAWGMIKHLFDYKPYAGKQVGYSRNEKPFSFVYDKRIAKEEAIKQPKWIEVVAENMQKLVNESHGITGEQIRMAMQLDMTTFKRASKSIKADRRRAWRMGMTYYPLGYKFATEQPIKQVISKFKYIEMAKTDMPILTQWRTELPWKENSVQI